MQRLIGLAVVALAVAFVVGSVVFYNDNTEVLCSGNTMATSQSTVHAC